MEVVLINIWGANAMTAVKLIDEEVDDLEKYDFSGLAAPGTGGELDERLDLYNNVDMLPDKQRAVVLAYLSGLTYNELNVTEKYFRYHLNHAIHNLRRKLQHDYTDRRARIN